MLIEVYTGETVRLSADHLRHADEGPVADEAIVTITLIDSEEVEIDEQTATTGGGGDDWFADFIAPEEPGDYQVKIVATKSGAIWKGKDTIRVNAF